MKDNKIINAIIIDDEERARRTLRLLIEEFCPNVKILGSYKSVPEGVLAINKLKPQLVFLDIEMPEYNGFELLGFFRDIDFEIIFVTAYNQYALKAFEVSAVDYLLKPVDSDLLIKAINKASLRLQNGSMQNRLSVLQENTKSEVFKRIALPVSDGLLFVEIEEIVLLEAEGAYTSVFFKGGTQILVSKRLKFFEEVLKNRTAFYRPHRSFIVNINFVKKLNRSESTLILDNKKAIPLPRNKKNEFEDLLKRFNLVVNN
ncbi:MAG: LytR/AlgR family response regulator transcription factor [Saprospiraceae bacterium]